MYFVVCYIVLTVRGNLKMPKAKRFRYCIFVLHCYTRSNNLSDLIRTMWCDVYRYHYGYSLPINVYYQIEIVAQWLPRLARKRNVEGTNLIVGLICNASWYFDITFPDPAIFDIVFLNQYVISIIVDSVIMYCLLLLNWLLILFMEDT